MEVLYRIAPTDIKVGILNFSTGCIEKYNFTAEYVYKMPMPYVSCGLLPTGCIEKWLLKKQLCYVLGEIHYDNGTSYKRDIKLTYTDDGELDKIGVALETAEYLDEKKVDYHSITKNYV